MGAPDPADPMPLTTAPFHPQPSPGPILKKQLHLPSNKQTTKRNPIHLTLLLTSHVSKAKPDLSTVMHLANAILIILEKKIETFF